MKLIKWILLSLFTLGSTVMAAPPDAKPRLGVNLAGPADWATELPFVDVFRTSRPWISQKNGAGWGQGPELAIDEFGWVKQLQPDCYAESMLCTISDGHYPSGVYTVIYEGEGEIEFGKGPRIVDAAPGRIRIDVDSSRGGFSLQIKRTGLQATKLHFPGTMGTEDSIAFKDVMATLTAVREVVGDDKILAWDPYPGSAESATKSVDEAKQMIRLMDELGYA